MKPHELYLVKSVAPIGLVLCALLVSLLAWRGYFTPAVVINLLGMSLLC